MYIKLKMETYTKNILVVMSTTVTKQGLGKMHVWYLHRFLLFRNARQNELSS